MAKKENLRMAPEEEELDTTEYTIDGLSFGKASKAATKTSKVIRVTITMTEDIRAQAKALAFASDQSFSGYISGLIKADAAKPANAQVVKNILAQVRK